MSSTHLSRCLVPHAHAPGQRTGSAGHMAARTPRRFRDISRSRLTRAEPPARLCVRWPDSISATRTGNSAFVAFAGCATVMGGFARLGRITVLRVVADRRSPPPHPGVLRRARGHLRGLFGAGIGRSDRLSPPIGTLVPPGHSWRAGVQPGAATSGEFGQQLLALRGRPRPVGVGGRPMRCSPTPSVHGGESGRVVRDERGGGGGGEGGAGCPGLT
jgi:hypothetical protein